MLKLTNKDVMQEAKKVADLISMTMPIGASLFGIPRGGVPAAYAVCQFLDRAIVTDEPEHADFFIDDLIDSGATVRRWCDKYPGIPFFALITKTKLDPWIIFPWEKNEKGAAEDIPLRLLQYVGEDIDREGLQETPERFLKAWEHWTSGYGKDDMSILKTFEDGAEGVDEMVLVKNIPIYSQCEHHLAPFFGVAHIGYIPNKKIVGLSKLSRLVDMYARRLQVQERLTQQIANSINKNLNPTGVAVVLECRHLCMESRGISQQGHTTVTSAMRGALLEKESARAEFLNLIKG